MLKLEIEANEDEISIKMEGKTGLLELSNTVEAVTKVFGILTESLEMAKEEVQKWN